MRSPALLALLLALALAASCRARSLKGAPEIKAGDAAAPVPTLEPLAPELAPAALPLAASSGAPGRGLKQSCVDRTSWCSSWFSKGYCSSGYVYDGQSVATYWCPVCCGTCGSGSASSSGSSSGGSGSAGSGPSTSSPASASSGPSSGGSGALPRSLAGWLAAHCPLPQSCWFARPK